MKRNTALLALAMTAAGASHAGLIWKAGVALAVGTGVSVAAKSHIKAASAPTPPASRQAAKPGVATDQAKPADNAGTPGAAGIMKGGGMAEFRCIVTGAKAAEASAKAAAAKTTEVSK
jgi:hypothetical protein